jgi:hypothetical protein
MRFESKYLIRWGIPGWVFSMWIFIYLLICFDDLRLMFNTNTNSIKLLSFFITLAGIGVPIGYLFHQIYFSFDWVRRNKNFFFFKKNGQPSEFDTIIDKIGSKFPKWDWKKKTFTENYFYIEFIWQKELLLLPEDRRNYLSDRYRHFLSVIHGLGSLNYSLLTSLAIGIVIIFEPTLIDGPTERGIMGLFIFFHLGFITLVFFNINYYSRNLINFQAEFLHEMIFGHRLQKK